MSLFSLSHLLRIYLRFLPYFDDPFPHIELRQALLPVRPTGQAAGSTLVGTTMSSLARDTFTQLDSSADSVFPNRFVLALRTNFPQPFDQVGNSGHHMQQGIILELV